MAHLMAQVTVPYDSNIPRDASVNTWHFAGSDSASTMASNVQDRLEEFYGTDTSNGASIMELYSAYCNPALVRLKCYDMDEPQPRAPILNEIMTLANTTPSTTTSLPSEVALCGSYYAAPESGVPVARTRGRIYLGPFNVNVATTTAQEPSIPSLATRTTVSLAMDRLATASTAGTIWVVYSKTDNQWRNVVGGWIDDAWDTQRRRGTPATTRTVWTA